MAIYYYYSRPTSTVSTNYSGSTVWDSGYYYVPHRSAEYVTIKYVKEEPAEFLPDELFEI